MNLEFLIYHRQNEKEEKTIQADCGRSESHYNEASGEVSVTVEYFWKESLNRSGVLKNN